jgi:hypothetical protein
MYMYYIYTYTYYVLNVLCIYSCSSEGSDLMLIDIIEDSLDLLWGRLVSCGVL